MSDQPVEQLLIKIMIKFYHLKPTISARDEIETSDYLNNLSLHNYIIICNFSLLKVNPVF